MSDKKNKRVVIRIDDDQTIDKVNDLMKAHFHEIKQYGTYVSPNNLFKYMVDSMHAQINQKATA